MIEGRNLNIISKLKDYILVKIHVEHYYRQEEK